MFSHWAQYKAFVTSLSQIHIPTTNDEAMRNKEYKATMDDEMQALAENHTWELSKLPHGKRLLGCRWIYTIKYKEGGTLDKCNVRHVAKGYTQSLGIDYFDTFALVTKFNSENSYCFGG